MPIQYSCSSCQKRLSISRRKAGELVACPVCGVETQVPLEDEVATPEFAEADQSTEQTEEQYAQEPAEIEAEREAAVPELPAETSAVTRSTETSAADDDDDPPFQLRKAQTEFDEIGRASCRERV